MSAEFLMGGVLNGKMNLDPAIPQVVIYGRSNAGKSTTINCITQKKGLARVSNTPGRTREINVFFINKAWYLIDMPGYGYARVGKKEKSSLAQLIAWFIHESVTETRKSIVVIDSKIGLTESDRAILKQLTDLQESVVILMNKVDRLTQKQLAKSTQSVTAEVGETIPVILFSAKTGKGREQLLEVLSSE